MRLFVSVDLPATLSEGIAAVQELFENAGGLDCTRPDQAHVTMKFLGDTPPHREGEVIEGLEQAVEAADVKPFEVTYGGLGVFPSMDYISVVWVGVIEGGSEFERLQAPIETQLVDRGFEEADHSFTPHVTIARMRHAGGKDHVQRVVRENDPIVGTTTVDAVHLTESTLTAVGPEYETVHTVPL